MDALLMKKSKAPTSVSLMPLQISLVSASRRNKENSLAFARVEPIFDKLNLLWKLAFGNRPRILTSDLKHELNARWEIQNGVFPVN